MNNYMAICEEPVPSKSTVLENPFYYTGLFIAIEYWYNRRCKMATKGSDYAQLTIIAEWLGSMRTVLPTWFWAWHEETVQGYWDA